MIYGFSINIANFYGYHSVASNEIKSDATWPRNERGPENQCKMMRFMPFMFWFFILLLIRTCFVLDGSKPNDNPADTFDKKCAIA